MPIADLAEGQEVLAAPEEGAASDHASALIGTKIDVYEASLVHLVLVHEAGDVEVLHTTDEHPFHVVETGAWTRADRLRVGDGLSTISGVAELVGISFGRETVPVYNLSIPATPTYYVGDHGVWVHNCSWSAARRAYWAARGLAGPPQARIRVRVRGTGVVEERVVPKELHHIDGRGGSDPHGVSNLMEAWPWEHEAVDQYRHTGYDLLEVLEYL